MIREYTPQDVDRLRQMYLAQGMSYEWPDLGDELWFSRLVLESEGRVVMAILAKLTAEGVVMMDPEAGTPKDRWQWFKELEKAAEQDIYSKGVDQVQVFVPPEVKRFAGRLESIGWVRDPASWIPMCRFLQPSSNGHGG